MATKRRGDANDRAAVNMKKARISQIGRKASPRHPTLPSLKPRSPRPGLFIWGHLVRRLQRCRRQWNLRQR